VTNGNSTLWSSWVIAGPRHRVFFCGDSGFFGGLRDIGRDHGPFDLTLISSGAYSSTWPLIHMTPEDVVQAHVDVRGQLLLPIHWGTFNLAFHDWNEPAERAFAGRARSLSSPRPGQMVEPSRVADSACAPWWRGVPDAEGRRIEVRTTWIGRGFLKEGGGISRKHRPAHRVIHFADDVIGGAGRGKPSPWHQARTGVPSEGFAASDAPLSSRSVTGLRWSR
jgi:hypothetical protein